MKKYLLLLLIFYTVASKPPVVKSTFKSTISKNFLLGRYNYRNDTSFVRVPDAYTRATVYLKKETYRAFLKMRKAAAKDGVTLDIVSGTRSFYDQKFKWDSKWSANEFSYIRDPQQKVVKLLRWWSMPGTSRHHWGTDVDLNNLKPAYYNNTAAGKKMYQWMINNASKFGFYQPFNANRTSGYQEEKWHWSYVPLSRTYLREYLRTVTYADIDGCRGSKVAGEVNVIKNWVEAVNPDCK